MWQETLVLVLFISALVYLGRAVYRQFQAKSSCATGCEKCSAVDFKKIEARIREQKIQ